MGDDFKRLRRKLGVLALLMACVFVAGWVRSFGVNDFVSTDGKNATYRLGSYGGTLCFIRDTPSTALGRIMHWDSFDEGEENKYELWAKWNSTYGDEVEWQWDCWQFHFGAGKTFANGTLKAGREEAFAFPYWFFVIPLTLLSAYLLFSNPRTRNPSPEKLDTP